MVLDTSAVIAIHLQEAGYEKLFERLEASASTMIGGPTLFEAAMVLSIKIRGDGRGVVTAFLQRHGVAVIPSPRNTIA
jgi:uncharacterized protein with PIN domain